VDVKKENKKKEKYSESECVCLYFFYGFVFYDKIARIKKNSLGKVMFSILLD
jgi:hypothetical protein